LFKKLRTTIGERILRNKFKVRKRKRCIHDFQDAKSIGVLFKTNNLNDFQLVKNFLHYLREFNTKVIALCYIDTKKIPDYYLLMKGFNFFSKNSVNFFYIPNHQLVDDFMEQHFDILIDLSVENSFPVKYIGVLSNADFKIGMLRKNEENYYDLMIDIGSNKNIENLIENIKHYIPIFAGPEINKV
jgi:hypothetical protein